MSKTIQQNLLLGTMFCGIGQKYFEYTIHELKGGKKAMVNQMINRLKVNKNNLYATIPDEEGRNRFLKEFETGDTLQFAEIALAVFKMNDEQRNMVELICNGIARGEEIKFVNL